MRWTRVTSLYCCLTRRTSASGKKKCCYPVFRIYEGDEDALRKSDNPFNLAHYAGMQAWKQRSDDVRKLDYMKVLLAELNKRGWSHEEKMTLLWFIEGVMHIENDTIWNDGGQVHAA